MLTRTEEVAIQISVAQQALRQPVLVWQQHHLFAIYKAVWARMSTLSTSLGLALGPSQAPQLVARFVRTPVIPSELRQNRTFTHNHPPAVRVFVTTSQRPPHQI